MNLRHVILGSVFHDCPTDALFRRFSEESTMSSRYLTRLVRKERIESGTFNTIVVSPVESRKPSSIWQGAENLNIEVPMNWADY